MVYKTILVVDDSAEIRWITEIYLRGAGYDVATAANGLEGLEYLRGHPATAAVVLDLWMPVLDGLEFLKQRRREVKIAAIPVVLYSSEPDAEEHAEALGAAAVLPKTASRECLVAAVAHVLRPYSHRRQTSDDHRAKQICFF